MKKLVLVKLGGSLITDKTQREKLRARTLAMLARELKEASKKVNLIVGHGGGSFPHFPAKKYRVNEGIINKDSIKGFCLTHDAACRLNRLVVKAFLKAGINAASLQPSACMLCKDGKIIESFLEPINEMLKNGIMPVPYGDAALDLTKGITIISTEQVLAELAVKLKAERIVVAGIVPGVFTADPFKDKSAELIPCITRENFSEIRRMLSGSHGVDVTGGMLSKVEEMLVLADKGIKSQIVGAEKPGVLKKALLGKHVGTIIE
jgi:isopentenyl phosphate kinase